MDRRVYNVEARVDEQSAKYDDQLRYLKVYCKEDIVDKLQSYSDELELWKRWFIRMQREFDNLVDTQTTDKKVIMAQMKMCVDQ